MICQSAVNTPLPELAPDMYNVIVLPLGTNENTGGL